ncbi:MULTISPECIES: ABC transporter ATP-binding protein [unclassified Kitasatospora]|uniref:ABC transporter ATP-binding protein n=1 Tax=unclassified Kitasatospora TaxID=2633591 RepID=UPI0007094EF3|nr:MULTISPECIES: ABC transporter ATP-binding protein [unclassified Kitasatospora]KQV09902.1 ABC transporter ATP-binding protein [Kitasatospora sp. Root107]KRB70142.1 ABC transporter ATP-binding protein [Kitasatospora sp. Root187]
MNHPTDSQPAHSGPALEAVGLGLQYQGGWALRNCEFQVPLGRVCGVMGPNGSGKSTLLALGARLLAPTEGELRVLGEAGDTPELRSRVGFVAQDKPLYPTFTVAETLRLGRELNPHWDQEFAQRIVDQGELSGKTRIGSLSGGQRTRVALALALGKRPELLLLDEPMADLDPLARHQLMGTLMAEAAEHGTTIVLSSHILAELEGVIDHLLLVRSGRIVLAGDPDEILDTHLLLTGGGDLSQLADHTVLESRSTGRRTTALVRTGTPVTEGWESDRPSLENLLLGYLRSPALDTTTPSTHSKAAA